jgi:uncharacterized protein YciI
MKDVLFYGPADDMDRARQLFPAHRATWQDFANRDELLLIGPFTDPTQGAMGVFSTREAAEAFVRADPFVTEGLVKTWHVREWREALVP